MSTSPRAEGDVGLAVRAALRAVAPSRCAGRDLPDQLQLGSQGLGLDSIAIVEFLVRLEEELGVPFPEALLSDGPLTIGRLAEHLREALALQGRR